LILLLPGTTLTPNAATPSISLHPLAEVPVLDFLDASDPTPRRVAPRRRPSHEAAADEEGDYEREPRPTRRSQSPLKRKRQEKSVRFEGAEEDEDEEEEDEEDEEVVEEKEEEEVVRYGKGKKVKKVA